MAKEGLCPVVSADMAADVGCTVGHSIQHYNEFIPDREWLMRNYKKLPCQPYEDSFGLFMETVFRHISLFGISGFRGGDDAPLVAFSRFIMRAVDAQGGAGYVGELVNDERLAKAWHDGV